MKYAVIMEVHLLISTEVEADDEESAAVDALNELSLHDADVLDVLGTDVQDVTALPEEDK